VSQKLATKHICENFIQNTFGCEHLLQSNKLDKSKRLPALSIRAMQLSNLPYRSSTIFNSTPSNANTMSQQVQALTERMESLSQQVNQLAQQVKYPRKYCRDCGTEKPECNRCFGSTYEFVDCTKCSSRGYLLLHHGAFYNSITGISIDPHHEKLPCPVCKFAGVADIPCINCQNGYRSCPVCYPVAPVQSPAPPYTPYSGHASPYTGQRTPYTEQGSACASVSGTPNIVKDNTHASEPLLYASTPARIPEDEEMSKTDATLDGENEVSRTPEWVDALFWDEAVNLHTQ